MYTSCIVIAVEYNKLNIQKKIIYMNINDNFLSDLIFFKSLKFFFLWAIRQEFAKPLL